MILLRICIFNGRVLLCTLLMQCYPLCRITSPRPNRWINRFGVKELLASQLRVHKVWLVDYEWVVVTWWQLAKFFLIVKINNDRSYFSFIWTSPISFFKTTTLHISRWARSRCTCEAGRLWQPTNRFLPLSRKSWLFLLKTT